MSQPLKTVKRFTDAFNGLRESFRTQVNFRFHIAAALLVIALGFFFHISNTEWIAVLITIVIVIAFEQINTVVEYFVDFVSPEYHPIAGKIKDMAAGAVLLAAIGAVAVGTIIFLPKLLALIQ